MFVIENIEPLMSIDPIVSWCTDRADALATVLEKYDYWNAMTEPDAEFPAGTKVTLNTDHALFPTTYFLAIRYPEGYEQPVMEGRDQVDIFHMIFNDQGVEDVSWVDGHQCAYCGATNTVTEEQDNIDFVVPNILTKPVWRQDPSNTGNILCDDCADARLATKENLR
jgi:hypothetical protein